MADAIIFPEVDIKVKSGTVAAPGTRFEETKPQMSEQNALRGTTGLCFEEFEVGSEYWTPGRTITEADFLMHSMFSGDWNSHHVDHVFAEATATGERIAHAALVLSVSTGLFVRIRVFENTIVALLEWTYRFKKPVLIGTRVQLRVRVAATKVTSNANRGVVTFDVSVVDEHDAEYATGEWTMLVLTRAGRDVL
jgi:acyl dehydratase